jgi:hypothetical protein
MDGGATRTDLHSTFPPGLSGSRTNVHGTDSPLNIWVGKPILMSKDTKYPRLEFDARAVSADLSRLRGANLYVYLLAPYVDPEPGPTPP